VVAKTLALSGVTRRERVIYASILHTLDSTELSPHKHVPHHTLAFAAVLVEVFI
jgi:hypothetical protein